MNILAVNLENMKFCERFGCSVVRFVHKTFMMALSTGQRVFLPIKQQRFSLHQHVYYALLKAIENS